MILLVSYNTQTQTALQFHDLSVYQFKAEKQIYIFRDLLLIMSLYLVKYNNLYYHLSIIYIIIENHYANDLLSKL